MFAVSARNTQRGIEMLQAQRRQAETEAVSEQERRHRQALEDRRRDKICEARRLQEEAIAAAIERMNRYRKETGLPYRPTLVRIMERICKATGYTKAEILSDRRNRDVVLIRQAIIYWACRSTSLSLPAIGRLMHRDHTSCLHAKTAYPKKRAKMGRYLRPVR